MIKIQSIDQRGFLKRTWKEERKLQSKLKIGDTPLLDHIPAQSTDPLQQSKLSLVWEGMKKLGSSIINKFRRQNPQTIVNVDLSQKEKEQPPQNGTFHRQEVKTQKYSQQPTYKSIKKQKKYHRHEPLDLSKFKQASNSETAFIEIPRKRRIPDETHKSRYTGDYQIPIDSLKKNIKERMEASIRASKIINEQWANHQEYLTKSSQQKDRLIKRTSNHLDEDGKSNQVQSEKSADKKQIIKEGGGLEWLDKMEQQIMNKKQVQEKRLKQIEEKQKKAASQPVINMSQNTSSLFPNVPILNPEGKSNFGLFQNKQSEKSNVSNKGLFTNLTNESKPSFLFNNEPKQVTPLPPAKQIQVQQNNNKPIIPQIGSKDNSEPQEGLKLFDNKSLFNPASSSLFTQKGGLFDNANPGSQNTLKIDEKPAQLKVDSPSLEKKEQLSGDKKVQPASSLSQKKPSVVETGQVKSPKPTEVKKDNIVETKKPQQTTPSKPQSNPWSNIFVNPTQTKVINFQQIFGSPSVTEVKKDPASLNDPFKKPPAAQTAPIWGNTQWAGNTTLGGNGGMQTEDMMVQGHNNLNSQNNQTSQNSFFSSSNNQINNPFQGGQSFIQPSFMQSFSPLQAKNNFITEMTNNNLGNALIAGAASFFQPTVQKQQSLFANTSPMTKPNQAVNKTKKKLEPRAFQN